MSIAPPRLDDLDAAALVRLAQTRLASSSAGWEVTDPADPGLALLEAFAEMTSAELERLNRLPSAMYASYMSMLGAVLSPGRCASASLRFKLAAERTEETVIPEHLRVSATGYPDAIYCLVDAVCIPAGETVASGIAVGASPVVDCLVGTGTGAPGQSLSLPHENLPGAPQAVATVDVIVRWNSPTPAGTTIDTRPDGSYLRFVTVDGSDLADTGAICAVDRVAGRLWFPLRGDCIPPLGAQIFASYWYQDSPAEDYGPLPADQLTSPLEPIPGIAVSNPEPSSAAIAAETPPLRLERGPGSLFASGMALRARDYEALAIEAHPAVARAHAFSPAESWEFSEPGLVRVLVGSKVASDDQGYVSLERLLDAQADEEILPAVRERLALATPLGVTVQVDWLPAKPVAIAARVYVSRGADTEQIAAAVRARIGAHISPVPSSKQPAGGSTQNTEGWPNGWPLGRPLRRSELIETMLAVPGVRAVDRIRQRPRWPMQGEVSMLDSDSAQIGIWFALMGGVLYRTLDDGLGWTRAPIGEADGSSERFERIAAVCCHPVRSGLIAAVTQKGEIHVSYNCGQTFQLFAAGDKGITRLLWADGSETPRLLCGGETALAESAGPLPDSADGLVPAIKPLAAQDGWVGSVYDIAAYPDGRGGRLVAVARRALGGVVLSIDSGWDGGYRAVGLEGHDVRALVFANLADNPDSIVLIAGCARPLTKAQSAIMSATVDPDSGEVGSWQPMASGWPDSGVIALAVDNKTIWATTEKNGLLRGQYTDSTINWHRPSINDSLPKKPGSTGPIALTSIALAPLPDTELDASRSLLVGGLDNLFMSKGDAVFTPVAVAEGADRISIPADWTLCADPAEIEVAYVTD